MYCHLPKKSATAIADCLAGTNSKSPSIYILWDSHASNHYPSIKEAVAKFKNKPQVRFLVDWGLINLLSGSGDCGSRDSCIKDSWVKHRDFLEKHIRRGDIVVFSWFRNRIFRDEDSLPSMVDYGKIFLLKNYLIQLASTVNYAGSSVVLVDDIPLVGQPGVNYKHTIFRMRQFDKCSMPENISLKQRRELTKLYKDLAALHPGKILYFDPHPYLCNGGVCDILDRGNPNDTKILYGDSRGHFRPEYPTPLTGEWQKFLLKALQPKKIILANE